MPRVEASALLHAADVVLDDRTVLRGIELRIGPGITLVRGQNGAGKTTLLRALAGLLPLARGTREIPADVLYLGHRPQLHRALSAAENLWFFARYRGHGSADVDGALASWGVPRTSRPAERLSAGQRRRAALARLETEPCALVLLDEPFAELDDGATARLAETVGRCAARGQAVVIATHAHAGLATDRTVRLEAGAIVGA